MLFLFASLLVYTSQSLAQSTGRTQYGLSYPPRATYDVGASSGSYTSGNSSYAYTELDAGLNLFFADWFDFRNALFYRFVTNSPNVFGLDTSVRGVLDVGQRGSGFVAFAGPGYRLENDGDDVPFVEAGLIIKLSQINVGGGVRQFLHSWVHDGTSGDTLFFIILSGGGAL